MKLGQLTLLTALALSAAACAADRSKQMKAAQAELTSAQLEAKRNEARLKEKQAQEAAAERARLEARQLEERKKAEEEKAETLGTASEDVVKAHAAMQRERATTEADSRERLQKAEARATEAKDRSSMVPAGKRAKFDEAVKLYDTKKAEVQKDIEDLKRAPDDKWNEAKKKVQNGLDALDRFADRIHDNI